MYSVWLQHEYENIILYEQVNDTNQDMNRGCTFHFYLGNSNKHTALCDALQHPLLLSVQAHSILNA